jgi:hypothetical protein
MPIKFLNNFGKSCLNRQWVKRLVFYVLFRSTWHKKISIAFGILYTMPTTYNKRVEGQIKSV